MKQDFLMELLKHDELASAIKKDIMEQISRTQAKEKLIQERDDVRTRAYNYEQKAREKIDKLDQRIKNINMQENALCSIMDRYDDQVDGSPHFSEETVQLLIDFITEYKTNE